MYGQRIGLEKMCKLCTRLQQDILARVTLFLDEYESAQDKTPFQEYGQALNDALKVISKGKLTLKLASDLYAILVEVGSYEETQRRKPIDMCQNQADSKTLRPIS